MILGNYEKTVRIEFDVLVKVDKLEMLPTSDKILKREIDSLNLTILSCTPDGRCELILQHNSKKITDKI